LESFGEVEVKTDYRDEPSPFVSLIARRTMDGDTFAQVHLDYAASGTCHLSIEYQIKEGWHTMLDHDFPELDSMEIGRLLARAELAILANELESGTEALDYWITEVSAHHSESRYSQSDWARVRNVSRQTVNRWVNEEPLPLVEDLSQRERRTVFACAMTANEEGLEEYLNALDTVEEAGDSTVEESEGEEAPLFGGFDSDANVW
jgi:hypothetical protein